MRRILKVTVIGITIIVSALATFVAICIVLMDEDYANMVYKPYEK